MLRRLASHLWCVLGISSLLLALLISWARFGLPYLHNQRDLMQSWLQQASGQPAQVGGLTLAWTRYGPTLALEDLQLGQPQASWQLQLDSAYLHLDLWQSLLQRQWVLGELELVRPRLTLASQHWSARLQQELSGQVASTTDIAPLLQRLLGGFSAFSLRQGQLQWQGKLTPLARLAVPQLRWRNQGDRHWGDGELVLQEGGTHNRLRLQADFTGPASAPAQLAGQLYLSSQLQDAGLLSRLLLNQPAEVQAQLDLSLWLTRQAGQWQSLLVKLGENQLAWRQQERPQQLAVRGGLLQWLRLADGWQLATRDIQVHHQADWHPWQAQLDKVGERLQGRLDDIELGALRPLLSQWLPADSGLGRALAGLAPNGRLTDLTLSQEAGEPWWFSGRISQLQWQQWAAMPGAQGVELGFAANGEQARFSLTAPAQTLPVGDNFLAPLPLTRLQLAGELSRLGDGWRLAFADLDLGSGPLTANGQGALDLLPGQSPVLHLDLGLDLADAGQAWRYYPVPAMGQELVAYLKAAIQGGRVQGARLLWDGAPAHFPFHDGSGVFQVAVPLQQAEFAFQPDWLPIRDLQLDMLFQNDSLQLASQQGSLGQVAITRLDALFPHLWPGQSFFINADVQGQGSAVRDYLKRSPLADTVGEALTQIQVEGPVQAALQLAIPLAHAMPQVSGQVTLANNRVRYGGLTLEGATGTLLFNDTHTRFDQLQASLWGQPLRLNYQGHPLGPDGRDGYGVQLSAQGQWLGQQLPLAESLRQRLSGQFQWAGQLDLTLKGETYDYKASLNSDLQGLTLTLPAPYRKAAELTWPLRLAARGNQEGSQLLANLNEDLLLEAKWDEQAALRRLALSNEQGRALAKEGTAPLELTLAWPELELSPWVALLSGLSGTLPDQRGLPSPRLVRLRTDSLLVGRHYFHDVGVKLQHSGQDLLGQLSSDELTGQLRRPHQADQPWELELTQLRWPQGEQADVEPEPSPTPAQQQAWIRQLPWVRLRCLDCQYGDLALGRFSGEIKPSDKGVDLRDLNWQPEPGSRFTGRGHWWADDQHAEVTLAADLKTDSLATLDQSLGIASGLQGAPATGSLSLRWPGPLYSLDFAHLDGKLSLQTGAGVLKQVDSTGARLLSVLSLSALLKRINLDFRDVFQQGFAFDSIHSSAVINQGVMRNQDFRLKSSAGELTGQGKLDLVAETLDYQIQFAPQISGGLAAAAAVTATPIAGVYVLALSTLLEPVIDSITQVKYQVSGPWRDPVVKELERKQKTLSPVRTGGSR
ncbi:YhdP family protein [Pseudaeromonas paramecii]|uniref:YhdP family protein n=1 Tax=Pseudaeromonas paramecii TaxID=2138166 RepID=A0ABP8QLS9_9GAMM